MGIQRNYNAAPSNEGGDAASPWWDEDPDGWYDDTSDEYNREIVDEKEFRKRENRRETLVWIKDMETTMGKYKIAPPTDIVLYPDLIERAWGWRRLVVFEESETVVQLPTFVGYLKEYFRHNAASLCTTRAAASRCLDAEASCLAIHAGDLTADYVRLSDNIRQRASCVLNSGTESFPVAAGLVCIAEESEMIADLSRDDFKIMYAFSNYIRQSALNLTRYRGPESEAVAAVLLGMSKETRSVHNVMKRDNTNISVEEAECGFVREGTCQLLEKLEDYFAREIGGKVDGNASAAGIVETDKPGRRDNADDGGHGNNLGEEKPTGSLDAAVTADKISIVRSKLEVLIKRAKHSAEALDFLATSLSNLEAPLDRIIASDVERTKQGDRGGHTRTEVGIELETDGTRSRKRVRKGRSSKSRKKCHPCHLV